MRKLRALEDVLIRVESVLAVVLVLTMLLLAAYNVVYRNVFVPLQQHWAHSGPPVERPAVAGVPAQGPAAPEAQAEPKAETKVDAKADTKAVDSAREGGADDFGGFGGGLGDDEEEDEPAPAPKVEPEAKAAPVVAVAEPAKPAADDFGGFGGGLGDDEDEDEGEDEPAPTKAVAPSGDDFGGFGGGLGDDAKADTKAPAPATADPDDDDLDDDEGGEDDLGDDDQFANLAEIDAVAKQSVDAIPQGGPPPAGSFAAWAVGFIDDIKLDWIDIFLRQLVIIVAFFGAMLATQRGKHINVDALSKLLPAGPRRVVAVLLPLSAVAVCLVLARAGWDLVSISREYPKDIMPSVPEWTLQLMFPVGFGLLAVHFVVRVLEAALVPPEPDPPPRAAAPPPPAAAAADEDEDDTDAAAAAGKGGQG